MKIIQKIKEIYGNLGYFPELIFAIILTILLNKYNIPFNLVNGLLNRVLDSTITFFSILVGFLITTFSILFLYNPENSETLMKFRKHKSYKKMLYSFISTSLIIIVSIIILLIFKVFNINEYWGYEIIFILLLSSLLRILKCIFYLSAVIDLS